MNRLCQIALLTGLTLVAAPYFSSAMEINLAMPWSSTPSGPHDARLVFYSEQSDDLLFTDQKEIVIHCRAGLRSVGLSWTLARNLFDTPFLKGDAEAFPANQFVIRLPTDKLKPGFYDVRVLLDSGIDKTINDGKPLPGICTFGWQVDKMPITPDRAADFKAFWDAGKAALAKIPVDPQLEPFQTFKGKEIDDYNLASACMPGDYDPKGHRTEEVESAKMTYAGIGGIRIYGWLAKPTGKGPFPAMLVLPGAGFAARPRPLEHARHGFLALDIQIHGQDVDLKGEYPKLPGYYDKQVYEPVQGYYYYNVYLNLIQAVNYLASRPDVDKNRIVVVGGSQGGRMSVCLSGLDSRIAATVPAIAHNANLPYLKWAEACNKAQPPTDGMDRDAPPALPDTPEGRCLGYYDDISFAPDVHCPVLMGAGLVDPVSPPCGTWAIFNLIPSADKHIVPFPGLGHDWSPEFDRRAWHWLDKELKLQPLPGPALPPAP
jgi:cephalosporin-C deacetylase